MIKPVSLSPTKAYLKIVTVSVRDISHLEEHHCDIKDIGMAKSYVEENNGNYELCSLYVMHPELVTLEEGIILEMNGVNYK